jgi:nitrate/TMAO reductase-like tetraheme cytochrome c subunit
VLPKALACADRVILLGWIEGRPTESLAREFADAALVVSGDVPRGSPELLRREGAPMMLVAERAQYVGEVELGPKGVARSGVLRWLGPDVADDLDAAQVVSRWKDAVKPFALPKIRELLAGFRAADRAGSASCRECHATAHATWASSAHARAMRTLESAHEERNPVCLRCHFQDLVVADAPSQSELDVGVGCEACHGGAGRHAAARHQGAAEVSRLPKVEAAACAACHDAEHSPAFEFDSRWPKIVHCGATKGSTTR